MVADEMTGDTSNAVKERPVFIPPRKRQTNKKSNGTQNYVDHIANVQVSVVDPLKRESFFNIEMENY